MARLPRLAIPDEVHHVIQRGHNFQAVFVDDADRLGFLHALVDAAREHQLAVHAYALLGNEINLLVTPSTPQALSKTLQAVGRRYVAAFNRRHGRSGTLWDGRFRASVIESEHFFLSAMCWVERSPMEVGLVAEPAAWPWSSARHHLGRSRDALVTEHPLYWALGNTPFDREVAYQRALERGVTPAESRALLDATMRSLVLGSPSFIERLSCQTVRPLQPRVRGRPRQSKCYVPN